MGGLSTTPLPFVQVAARLWAANPGNLVEDPKKSLGPKKVAVIANGKKKAEHFGKIWNIFRSNGQITVGALDGYIVSYWCIIYIYVYIYIIWAHIYIHTFLFKTKQRAFWCWNRNLSVQGFLLPSSGEPESLPAITDKRKMGDQIWRDSFHFTYVSFYVPSYPKHWMYIVCMVYLHTFANLPLNYPKCRYVFPSHSWVSSYMFCSHMFQPSRRVPKWSRGIYFIQLPFVKENLCKNMMNWLMDVNGWTNPFGKYARQIRSWNLLRYFWNHLSNWKGTTSPLWKSFAIFCFPLHPFETAGKKNAWHDTHPHVFFFGPDRKKP